MNFTQLPHKSVILSGTIALAIILGGLAINFGPRFIAQREERNALSLATTSNPMLDQDSDGDTLADWAERLRGSDPFKADSDGDGTDDGEEARTRRNPIVANTAKEGAVPSDLLPTLQDPNFASSSTAITEARKAFFLKYLTVAGQEVRITTYRDLLSKFDKKRFTPTRTLDDLTIASDNTNEATRKFFNDFGAVILRYKTPNSPRSETEILNEFAQSKNFAVLKELDLSIIDYLNLAKDIRALSTPSGLAKTQLSIVEGYEGMALGLRGMQLLQTDPINGAGGYEGYVIYRVQVANGFATLIKELNTRGLTFTPEESGYMFYANVFAGE
jgi:hypothetical protein